ncbi:MAG: hypothetical protein LIO96_13525 [Lachnospiraceae bacterium]|nr:hypothetical protein [Lachnospiraceae bacterium]
MKETNGTVFENTNEISGGDNVIPEMTTPESVSDVKIEDADSPETEAETDQNAEPRKSIFELLEEDIMSSDLPVHEKNNQLSRLIRMREKKVNIILVGATGSGKSSTLHA